jgi:adenylate cyclase class IV
MYKDPIVEEVRKVRREIEALCHHDPDEYLRYLRKVQEQFKGRVVRGEPKPALPDKIESDGGG